jgi:hypothetical protein
MASARALGSESPFADPDQREANVAFNLNTCHVWAEGGDQVRAIRNGEPMEAPVWIVDRYARLGRDPGDWQRGGGR